MACSQSNVSNFAQHVINELIDNRENTKMSLGTIIIHIGIHY